MLHTVTKVSSISVFTIKLSLKLENDLCSRKIDCLEGICSDYGDSKEYHQNFFRVLKLTAVLRSISIKPAVV